MLIYVRYDLTAVTTYPIGVYLPALTLYGSATQVKVVLQSTSPWRQSQRPPVTSSGAKGELVSNRDKKPPWAELAGAFGVLDWVPPADGDDDRDEDGEGGAGLISPVAMLTL
jgi:hypothetical protein